MRSNDQGRRSSRLGLWVGMTGMGVGIVVGFLVGIQPLLVGLALVAVAAVVYFFSSFEQAVLSLLILRPSLDIFAAQQLPSAFAIGIEGLTLLYVTMLLLTGRTVRTDSFWWFFVGWVILQALWVILMALGVLGLDASFLPNSIREWTRLFLWPMGYLLVMQLKGRLPPQKIISLLFFSLIIPLIVASMQTFLPPSVVPPILSSVDTTSLASETGTRIKGTFGHPNVFATYVLLFIGLAWWKLGQSRQRWPWLILLGVLAFFYVSTKALVSLAMLATFVLVLIIPRLSLPKLMGGVLLFILVIGLFASTDFGQQRLGSLANTPLFNRDIDISRAILLSQGDQNSFNWRISQWYVVLTAWQQSPIFGYGLGLSTQLVSNQLLPHNDYIRAMAEGGVVGLVTFLVFFGAQILRIVQLFSAAPRGSSKQDLCLILLAIVVATLIGMSTENIWSHTVFFFYGSILLAIAGWDWNELHTSENSLLVTPLLK